MSETYENHIPAAVVAGARRAEELARVAGMANVPPAEGVVFDEPVAEPVLALEPAPAPAAPTEPVTDYEQMYKTLQGKYNSEIAQKQAEAEGLRRVLASFQHAPLPQAPAPASAPATTTPVIPPEDVDAYGQELIDATQRWVAAKYDAVIQRLVRRLDEIEGTTTQRVTKIETTLSEQAIFSAMDADPQLAGKWRIINQDPDFYQRWLVQIDPFTGQPRMQLLHDALARGKYQETSEFFRAYIKEHTAVTPAPAPPVVHTPDPGAGTPTLEELAAPGHGSGQAPPGAPAEKRVWKPYEVTAFFNDRQRGKYVGREAEAIRIEQDIFAAGREGRIK